MRLSELTTGEKGVIVKVLGHGGFRKRIVEMGFIKGKTVDVLLNAPLKDPIKYKVLGYEISLRRQEAEMIEVVSEEEAKKEANQKIKEEIRTQQEKSEELEKLGYTMYKRDYTSDMYSINNVTEYFMGKDNALYIIYAYGNENNTNEMDVVIM